MEEISLDDMDALWPEVELAVDATPGIDPWCSGPDWTIPVTTGFAPDARRILLTNHDRTGFALLARYLTPTDVPVLGGLEPLWGFAAPIFGNGTLAEQTAAHLQAIPDWKMLYLPGLPAVGERDSLGHRHVTLRTAAALSALGRVRLGDGITRQVADLTDGHDGWLARRSPRFRRNLRQGWRRAEAEGLVIEDARSDADLFGRIMAIEHRSWKGRDDSGITTPEMSTMYRLMIDRLRTRRRLLASVAKLDGNDIGYIVGGVRAGRYRGLQLSYSEEVGPLSVGNLLQHHQLIELDRNGLADTYDLGMDFDYKRRWADRAERSLAIIVDRR